MITVSGAFLPFTRIGEMIVQQLKKIGLQFDIIEVEQSLQERRRSANDMATALWGIDGSELILMFPQHAIPAQTTSMMGPFIGRWYASNGAQGVKPEDPQLIKALDTFRSAFGMEAAERVAAAKEVWKILAEECFTVGTVGLSPANNGVRIVKNTMGNVPARQMNAQHCRTPCSSHPPTLYFKS